MARTIELTCPLPPAGALVVKAKLEAVDAGITTVEHEFLGDILLPSGATVGEWTEPQIAAAYEHGTMPALLPGGERGNT